MSESTSEKKIFELHLVISGGIPNAEKEDYFRQMECFAQLCNRAQGAGLILMQ
jgi:hypothetical protein